MTSLDNTTDSRFDEADSELEAYEESLERGEPWIYPTKPDEAWQEGMPNPLVVRATGVTTGTINGDDVPFLNGVDARGKKWSRIIGTKSLKDVLLEGVLSEWSEEREAFVEVARVGQVRPGELVSIRHRGFSTIKSGPHKGKEIPSLKVERPDARADEPKQASPDDVRSEHADDAPDDDGIPF